MKLYTYEMAPNPRRIHLMLHYKGVDLDTQTIDLGKQEQLSDAYKAISPTCTVPALVLDDGTVLADSIAIAYYLDSVFPDKPVFGKTSVETAQVLGWCHRIFVDAFLQVADMFRNQSEGFKDRAVPGSVAVAQIPELVSRGKLRLDAFWPQLEAGLAEQDFLVGDQPSQADIDAFVTCDFAGWVKQTIPADCPRTQAWYQRCKALFTAES